MPSMQLPDCSSLREQGLRCNSQLPSPCDTPASGKARPMQSQKPYNLRRCSRLFTREAKHQLPAGFSGGSDRNDAISPSGWVP